MAYFATKRYSYWSQLAVLTGFIGGGLLIGGVVSLIPILGKIDLMHLHGSSAQLMDNLLVPQNATALRWMQFITTLFLFFFPAVFYAWLCHKKAFVHLGYAHSVSIQQVGFVVLIMLACLPLVSVLQDLTNMLPFSKAMFLQFKEAEASYNKEISIIGRMDNFSDYIVSMIVIAFMPAVFEETLFRGALQNLLSRWTKKPVLSVVVVAIVFSAVHGSYLGFLSRFALGFILGWMYYRTGNIWLNICAHFFNNALGVTSLYMATMPGQKVDPSTIDSHFPLWFGLVSLAAVIILFILLDKVSKKDNDHPGEEVLMPDEIDDHHHPLFNDRQDYSI